MIEKGKQITQDSMAINTRVEFFFPTKDPTLVNSIRLTIFQLVPHYAFNREKILIRENTSTRHNDEITQDISTMVVMGLDNSRAVYNRFLIENPSIIRGESESIVTDEDSDEEGQDKNLSILGGDVLTMSLRVTSTGPSVQYRYITTKDCTFHVNGKTIPDPYKDCPILLATLKEGEILDLEAKTDMNSPIHNPLYAAVGNAWFRQEKEGYRFFMDLRPGITGKEVLYRARDILLKRVRNVIQQNEIKEGKKTTSGELTIRGDRFIVPNLLAYYMAIHPNVSFAGPRCHHLLGDSSSVYYRASGDVTKILEEVYNQIESDSANLLKEVA